MCIFFSHLNLYPGPLRSSLIHHLVFDTRIGLLLSFLFPLAPAHSLEYVCLPIVLEANSEELCDHSDPCHMLSQTTSSTIRVCAMCMSASHYFSLSGGRWWSGPKKMSRNSVCFRSLSSTSLTNVTISFVRKSKHKYTAHTRYGDRFRCVFAVRFCYVFDCTVCVRHRQL